MIDIRSRSSRNEPVANRWMNRWSLLFLIICLIRFVQLFAGSITGCYIHILYVPTIPLLYFCGTMYQISRLQYCFKNEYSKYYFTILYANAILVTIFTVITHYLTGKVVFKNMDMVKCLPIRSSFRRPLTGICFVWILTLSGYLKFLYIYKIRHANREMNGQRDKGEFPHHVQIQRKHNYERFNIYLRKVLILTTLIEITVIIWAVSIVFIGCKHRVIYLCILITISMSCGCLMNEHNNYLYEKFIGSLCCCCCKQLISQHETNLQIAMDGSSTTNDVTITTDTTPSKNHTQRYPTITKFTLERTGEDAQ